MIDERTGKDLKDIPILNEPQLRIYVMLNEDGKIKIGKTKDIYKRYLSLCGSNAQGIQITNICTSPKTYLYSIETTMHNKFHRYRIPNTEWFYDKEDPTGRSLYKKAMNELKVIFSSTNYKKLNEMRKEVELKKLVGGDYNDN